MVFQDYALYPHLTVAQNIGFPLRVRHEAGTDVALRVAEVAEQLGIADLLRRLPGVLSGGERQRVAMARAIVRRPQRVPARRATVQSGRRPARGAALRRRRAGPPHRRDHRLRHARPGRGDDDGRPGRRAAPRRAATGRHTPGGVRRPGAPCSSPRSSAPRAPTCWRAPSTPTPAGSSSTSARRCWCCRRTTRCARLHTERVTLALRADAMTTGRPGRHGVAGVARHRARRRAPRARGAGPPRRGHAADLRGAVAAGAAGRAVGRRRRDRARPRRGPPRRGEPLELAVDPARLMFFDRAGDRIRF